MQHDLDRLDVGGHHDELADAAVERLRRLVRALLELLVMRRLLHEVQNLVRERRVGERDELLVQLPRLELHETHELRAGSARGACNVLVRAQRTCRAAQLRLVHERKRLFAGHGRMAASAKCPGARARALAWNVRPRCSHHAWKACCSGRQSARAARMGVERERESGGGRKQDGNKQQNEEPWGSYG